MARHIMQTILQNILRWKNGVNVLGRKPRMKSL